MAVKCNFFKGSAVERVHLQFCKRLLGVKKTTQNDFVYGEFGRTSLLTTTVNWAFRLQHNIIIGVS